MNHERSADPLKSSAADGVRVPQVTRRAAACEISRLLSAGRTVMLMDSGGMERTRQVCEHMGFVENTGIVENRR